jgi:DNA-binding NarL/FixJ family response regulator
VSPTRVFLADDHAILRAGLRNLIEAQPDLQVVGEAGDADGLTAVLATAAPDVVSLDLTMPGATGTALVERVGRECPEAKVLVLTMHDDPAYLRAALRAGAAGYVIKATDPAEYLAAIRAVASGETYIDSHLRDAAGPATTAEATPAGPPLSAREQQVLELLAQGHSYQRIATQLGVSVKTVETYRTRFSQKLGLRSRADLVRYALRAGLIGGPAGP